MNNIIYFFFAIAYESLKSQAFNGVWTRDLVSRDTGAKRTFITARSIAYLISQPQFIWYNSYIIRRYKIC